VVAAGNTEAESGGGTAGQAIVRKRRCRYTRAWYDKQCATFSETLAVVRRHLWRVQTLPMLEKSSDMIKIPRFVPESG
jgi:hypothetical protein